MRISQSKEPSQPRGAFSPSFFWNYTLKNIQTSTELHYDARLIYENQMPAEISGLCTSHVHGRRLPRKTKLKPQRNRARSKIQPRKENFARETICRFGPMSIFSCGVRLSQSTNFHSWFQVSVAMMHAHNRVDRKTP